MMQVLKEHVEYSSISLVALTCHCLMYPIAFVILANDMKIDQIANIIRAEADENGCIIFGTVTDPTMENRIRVTVIAAVCE